MFFNCDLKRRMNKQVVRDLFVFFVDFKLLMCVAVASARVAYDAFVVLVFRCFFRYANKARMRELFLVFSVQKRLDHINSTPASIASNALRVLSQSTQVLYYTGHVKKARMRELFLHLVPRRGLMIALQPFICIGCFLLGANLVHTHFMRLSAPDTFQPTR